MEYTCIEIKRIWYWIDILKTSYSIEKAYNGSRRLLGFFLALNEHGELIKL